MRRSTTPSRGRHGPRCGSKPFQYLEGKGDITREKASELQVKFGLEAKPAAEQSARAAPLKTVWSWCEANLKSLAPLVKGATIQQVINTHNAAWAAYYPGPKKSRAVSFGKNGVSSDAVVKHVFTLQWMRHRAQAAQPIPLELEEHLDLPRFRRACAQDSVGAWRDPAESRIQL